jgi:hypothetical protein
MRAIDLAHASSAEKRHERVTTELPPTEIVAIVIEAASRSGPPTNSTNCAVEVGWSRRVLTSRSSASSPSQATERKRERSLSGCSLAPA